MIQLPQTVLEKDSELFEKKKLDESYRYGRLLTNLENKSSLAVAKYDGELLHYGTHQGQVISLDISDVKLDKGVSKEVQTFKLIHKNYIIQPSCMDLEADQFFFGTTNGAIASFNRVSGKCTSYYADHTKKVAKIEVHDGTLYHVGFDGYFLVRNLQYERIVHSWISTKCPLSSLVVADSTSSIFVSSWDSTISQIDLRMRSCQQIKCGNSPVRDIKLHEDGNILCASHGIGGLRSWDLRNTEKPLRDYGLGNGHTDVINTLLLLKDRIYTGSDDLTVRVFDINKPRCLEKLRGNKAGVIHLFTSDSLLLAANHGSIRKYRMADINDAIAHAEELALQKKKAQIQGEEKANAKRSKKSRKSQRGRNNKRR